MEKEVKFKIGETEHSVVLRRLNFGEKNKVEEEATEIKLVNNNPVVSMKTSVLKEKTLLKAVVKSTLPLNNLKEIQDLPEEVGEMLYSEYTDMAILDEKKNNSLEMQ